MNFFKRIISYFPKFSRRQIFGLGVLIFLLIALPFVLYHTQKQQNTRSRAEETSGSSSDISQLTSKLMQASDITQMIQIAEVRKTLLLKEIPMNPAILLQNKISQEQRNNMPEVVKGFIEQDMTGTGTVVISHFDDFDNGKSRNIYTLVDGQNNKRTVYFLESPDYLKNNSFVTLTGVGIDDVFVVNAAADAAISSESEKSKVTTGNIRLAIVLVKFANTPYQPFPKESIENNIFGSTNDTLKTNLERESFNRFTITGKVYDYKTLPINVDTASDDCSDFIKRTSQVKNALTADGENLNQYDYTGYLFPEIKNCNASGIHWGTNEFYINGTSLIGVFMHELGHAIGIDHSGSHYCDNVSNDYYPKCRFDEFDDKYDVMGKSTYHGFNAPHKVQLGWIDNANIKILSSPGTYTVTISSLNKLLEGAADSVQVVKLPKHDTGHSYYLSYKPNVEVFTEPGVAIHFAENKGTQGKFRYVRSVYANGQKKITLLQDGTTFNDPINAITVKQISHDSESATVEITLPSVPQNPVISKIGCAKFTVPQFNDTSYILTSIEGQHLGNYLPEFDEVSNKGWGKVILNDNDTFTMRINSWSNDQIILRSGYNYTNGCPQAKVIRADGKSATLQQINMAGKSVAGRVFIDKNGNGKRDCKSSTCDDDQDDTNYATFFTAPPLKIKLIGKDSSQETDLIGYGESAYFFTNVNSGKYQIIITAPSSSYENFVSNEFTIAGSDLLEFNLGIMPITTKPLSKCATVSCLAPSAGYHYVNQVLQSCDSNVKVTCGDLVADIIATPVNARFSCSSDGTKATLAWDKNNGDGIYYQLRINKDPVSVWAPATPGSGDSVPTVDAQTTSYTMVVTAGSINSFSVQAVPLGKKSGGLEDTFYDASATRSDEVPFTCNLQQQVTYTCLGNSQVKIAWLTDVNAQFYNLRVDNMTDRWDGTCTSLAGDFCKDDLKDTSLTFSIIPGNRYQWWYHPMKGFNNWGSTIGPNQFTCPN